MKLVEDCRNLLNERMGELMQLSEDCLMILYLEIRVQCYYHLLIVLRKVCQAHIEHSHIELVNQ